MPARDLQQRALHRPAGQDPSCASWRSCAGYWRLLHELLSSAIVVRIMDIRNGSAEARSSTWRCRVRRGRRGWEGLRRWGCPRHWCRWVGHAGDLYPPSMSIAPCPIFARRAHPMLREVHFFEWHREKFYDSKMSHTAPITQTYRPPHTQTVFIHRFEFLRKSIF